MPPNRFKELFTVQINDEFHAWVNPFITNGISLLNTKQNELFLRFDGTKNITQIASESHFQIADIENFVSLVSRKRLLENREYNYPLIAGDTDSILDFWIHTTDSCNLNCQYCYIHTKDSKESLDATVLENFTNKLIETIKRNNISTVKLRLAGGEPLLKFNYWKLHLNTIKKRLKNHNCSLKAVFLTNLTLLSNEIIDFIKTENIDIGVSLDGLGKYHNKTRPYISGQGSFKTIIHNLEWLIDNNIFPSIMTVVSNNNLDGLADFTRFLIEKKLPHRFTIVQSEEFNFEKATDIFHDIYKNFETKIENGYPFESLHSLGGLKPIDIFQQPCSSGLNSATIYTNGDIYFCQQQVGQPNPLGSIYSDKDLISIIKKGSSTNNNLANDCIKCKYRYVCSGGCPLIRIDGKSPSCNFYKEFIPVIYKLIGQERLFIIKKISTTNA